MNKTEIKKFRRWMLENYGIQDASNYKGTQTEEIAIRYAETKVKKLNKPVVKRSKLPKKKGKNGESFFQSWDKVIKNIKL